MKARLLASSALILLLTGCAQNSETLVSETPSAPIAVAPPAAPEPPPAADPALLAAAQAQLRALGYATGKNADAADLQKAIAEFQKDQGLPQDGALTPALLDRMKMMRAELVKGAPVARDASFAYDNGDASRRAMGLLMTPPPGLIANAPANFLQPLRPGAQASYQWGKRDKDGNFTAAMTVTCRAGRLVSANIPVGAKDVIAVECHGDGVQPWQWRSLYSPSLGLVVRQERDGWTNNLVAVRPFTGDWPAAARTGLDWALTHALGDMPPGAPVQWSSTGVAPHFEIKASGKISGQEAGLSAKNAALSCRRFEMVQTGPSGARYPGIACQAGNRAWSLPGTAIQFAARANGVTRPLQSPQK